MPTARAALFVAALAAALAVPARAGAQDTPEREEAPENSRFIIPLTVGALVALNLSSFVGADPQQTAGVDTKVVKAGFAGGVFLGWRHDFIGARLEALVSSKGASFSQDQRDGSAALYYLEFPLTAQLYFPIRDLPLEARAHGGMSVAYRLGGDLRDNAGNDQDLRPATRNLDVGLLIGGGLAWRGPGESALLLELRYQFGLLGIGRDERDLLMTLASDAHNSVLSIQFGFEI